MSDFGLNSFLTQWSLLRRDTGSTVVADLRIADSYWSKLAGLQFHATMPTGRGLMLCGTSSVHTFWMRFAIDLAFIGADGNVLEFRQNVRPWRVAIGPKGTLAILETKAGWLDLEPAARLIAGCASENNLKRRQKSLWFLNPVTLSVKSNTPIPRTAKEHDHAKV
jgi:uncharacterized membrane protein (UPF0127 family)